MRLKRDEWSVIQCAAKILTVARFHPEMIVARRDVGVKGGAPLSGVDPIPVKSLKHVRKADFIRRCQAYGSELKLQLAFARGQTQGLAGFVGFAIHSDALNDRCWLCLSRFKVMGMNKAETASGREVKRSSRSAPSCRLEAAIALFTTHAIRNSVRNRTDTLGAAL